MDKIHVEVDAQFGRVIVLSDDVKSGEVVVDELPFAFGPKYNSGIVCLGCYMYLQFDEDGDSLDRCEKCDWPLCSACIDSVDHQPECEVFHKANVKFAGNVSSEGICTQLDCITPLSTLSLIYFVMCCYQLNAMPCFLKALRCGNMLLKMDPLSHGKYKQICKQKYLK